MCRALHSPGSGITGALQTHYDANTNLKTKRLAELRFISHLRAVRLLRLASANLVAAFKNLVFVLL